MVPKFRRGYRNPGARSWCRITCRVRSGWVQLYAGATNVSL